MEANEILDCSCCKSKRKTEKLKPRQRVPVVFKEGKEPVWLCEHCDGDSLLNAQKIAEASE